MAVSILFFCTKLCTGQFPAPVIILSYHHTIFERPKHLLCSKQDICFVPSKTSPVFQAGHLLCSKQDMSCVQITNTAHATFERIKPIVLG